MQKNGCYKNYNVTYLLEFFEKCFFVKIQSVLVRSFNKRNKGRRRKIHRSHTERKHPFFSEKNSINSVVLRQNKLTLLYSEKEYNTTVSPRNPHFDNVSVSLDVDEKFALLFVINFLAKAISKKLFLINQFSHIQNRSTFSMKIAEKINPRIEGLSTQIGENKVSQDYAFISSVEKMFME